MSTASQLAAVQATINAHRRKTDKWQIDSVRAYHAGRLSYDALRKKEKKHEAEYKILLKKQRQLQLKWERERKLAITKRR